MLKNKVHIFDLLSLIDIEQNPWIIEKNDPSKPLLVLTKEDYNLMKSGHFKSHDNLIEFSGKKFYLSNYIYQKLEKIIDKKNLEFDDLGVSLAEFLNPEIIEKKRFEIKDIYFEHLKNLLDDIFLIVPDFIDINYDKVKSKVLEKFEDLGLNVKNIFIIKSDNYTNINNDNVIFQKSLILLQVFTNYNIQDSKFIEEKYLYDEVNYYDEDQYVLKKIEENIQEKMEKIYFNSDEYIQKEIKKNIIKNRTISLLNISSNTLNKFIKNEFEILLPKNLITKFESFNFKNY